MTRTFGVELEFQEAEFTKVAKALGLLELSKPLKVSPRKFQAMSRGESWHLKYDFSVCSTVGKILLGGELASPAFLPTKQAFSEIRKCIKAIDNQNGTYDDDTGVHVHMDIDDIDRLKFITLWLRMEKSIYRLFPNRRDRVYTKTLTKDVNKHSMLIHQLGAIFTKYDLSKVFGCKNDAFRFYERKKKNFLEIRVGGMSGERYKITAWIKFCLQMIEATKMYKDSLSIMYYDDVVDFQTLDKKSCKELKLSKKEWDAVS